MKRHVPDGLLVAFRNDLKRNNCAMLRYAIFSSERSAGDGPDGSKQQQVGNAKRTDGAATANGREPRQLGAVQRGCPDELQHSLVAFVKAA